MKIGSWRVIKEGTYSTEWFNPASRLRIHIEYGDVSQSFHLFVFRHRRAPPTSGRAPFFSKFFQKRQDAVDYATELMKRENLTFTDLSHDTKENYDASVGYLKGMLDRLLTTKANMKHLSGTNVYVWGKEHIKASFITEGSRNEYFYFEFEPIGIVHPENLKFRVSIGPWNNYTPEHYAAEEDYLWGKIDMPLKKMVMWAMTLNITKEILSDWHSMHRRKNMQEHKPDVAEPNNFAKELLGVKDDFVWYEKDIAESEQIVNEGVKLLKHLKGELSYDEEKELMERRQNKPTKPVKNDDELRQALENLKQSAHSRIDREYYLVEEKINYYEKIRDRRDHYAKEYAAELEYIIDTLRRFRTRLTLLKDKYSAIHAEIISFLELDRK